VQGVGFRPFVHRLAARHGLAGFVLNDAEGVLAEIEGEELGPFLGALESEKPSLARIDGLDVTPLQADGRQGFTIRASVGKGSGQARIVPDTASCPCCVDELFDPHSRFYLYPFVTCTQCGPRFTIVHRLPYDRQNTAMAGFCKCVVCARDYEDPCSRRFHAETIACSVCGPRLSHSIADVADALTHGQIVALKGIGGFHLMCDATDEAAVNRLRDRKHRAAKPFAIMVANEASVGCYARAGPAERALLSRTSSPIVLLRRGAGLAASVAPGLDRVGVMLPAAPLHHLLFHALAGYPDSVTWRDAVHPVVIVATSANTNGKPPIIHNDEARDSLTGIADMVVTHDRPIVARADDSVMTVIGDRSTFIRRSRGFVPEPIDLGEDGPSVLAAGAHLKATLCVTRGREAFVSQHVGDLGSAATVRFYRETARRMLSMLAVTPDIAVCDLHPDYHSTLYAHATDLPVLQVQHHAAHIASIAAEHQLRGPVLGVALDGHGYGEGAAPWGGELMLVDGARWRRLGHLAALPFPGGDRAASEPWRMGVAALVALGRGDEVADYFPVIPGAGSVALISSRDTSGPVTTSMGRLFDAAAALLGVCLRQTYEGQAAMQLEALVDVPWCLPDGYRIDHTILDFRPLLAALTQPGLAACDGAAFFHGTLVAGLADWIAMAAAQHRKTDVALGGGCLTNRILAQGLADALRTRGLVPWLACALPANDGGLSLGQAAMGRAYLLSDPRAVMTLEE
jgi:hydrogenase maturation protein HypF